MPPPPGAGQQSEEMRPKQDALLLPHAAQVQGTHLQFPEEVQASSGFHLLGMQVQGQHEDRDDDRRHHLQCHLGRVLGAIGER